MCPLDVYIHRQYTGFLFKMQSLISRISWKRWELFVKSNWEYRKTSRNTWRSAKNSLG